MSPTECHISGFRIVYTKIFFKVYLKDLVGNLLEKEEIQALKIPFGFHKIPFKCDSLVENKLVFSS